MRAADGRKRCRWQGVDSQPVGTGGGHSPATRSALFTPHIAHSEVPEQVLCSGVKGWGRSIVVILGVLVKVASVARRPDVRHNRRGHLEGHQGLPVEALEPLVGPNVFGTCLEVAEPLGAIRLQQFLDEVLRVRVKVPWVVNFAGKDLLVDAKRVLVIEWRVPDDSQSGREGGTAEAYPASIS